MLRRTALFIFSIIFTLISLELIVNAAFFITREKILGRDYLIHQLLKDTDDKVLGIEIAEPEYMSGDILHPYLGFVRDNRLQQGINEFGFKGDEPIKKKSKDKIIISIITTY